MALSQYILLTLFAISAFSSVDVAKDYIIGIDLGTTYSCVGVFKNGRVEILQNEQGNRITPSYVSFSANGERLVGDAAKNQLTVNPTNTVFDAKRLIGRDFDEPSVQKDIKMWPFKVINEGGKPKIELTIMNQRKVFAPEEISAMVLSKMKTIAEERLQVNITNAVVTVPAYFTDGQRQSTKDAGTIAGLNVLRIINEPTAAAIAYGMNKKEEEKNILVFDLGGGTFDVSILTIDNGVFEVVSTNGDTHLGGEDFDQRVSQYVIKEIKNAKGVDVSNDQRTIQRVRREVEKAKRSLSKYHETPVDVDLGDKGEFSMQLTRAKFEELNSDLFRSTLVPMENALKDSGLSKGQIDEIILVGGSTRIPKIQQLVKQFFNGKEPNRGVNPDEAVAYGAAVQGGILSGDEETSGLVLLDVNALTLGVEVAGGTVQPIIKRNSKIPTKQTQIFTTVVDSQPRVQINIYEGERPMAADNNKLGSFELTGIPPAARGVPQIEVTFELDHNGIIHVSAQDKGSGRQNRITITNEQRQLKQEEIDRMIEDAQKYASEDQAAADKAKARSDFESSVYNLKNQLNDEKGLKDKLPEDDKAVVEEAINNAISWLDKNHAATIEELKEKKGEFDNAVQPIMAKLYQQTGGTPPPPQEGEEPRGEL